MLLALQIYVIRLKTLLLPFKCYLYVCKTFIPFKYIYTFAKHLIPWREVTTEVSNSLICLKGIDRKNHQGKNLYHECNLVYAFGKLMHIILRQLQEKHLAKNKKLYFAFVDLEKAFDRVPRKVIWWAMRKLGIEEWIVRFVQAMYNNTRSRVRVNNTYSDEFGVKVKFTRVRYLALSYSSLYSKLCPVSSALGHPGSCCMLMT